MRTGTDVTHVILTQIIAENAKESQIALPLHLLTEIVRASDKATHDFLSCYLNNALDVYQKAWNSVNTRLAETKNTASTPLDYLHNLLVGYSRRPTAEGGEAEQLRRRVDELQRRLSAAQENRPSRNGASAHGELQRLSLAKRSTMRQ
jgi:hypothetical protein